MFLLGMLLVGLLLSSMGLAFEDVALALVALLLLVVFGALTVWQIIASRKKKSMAVATRPPHRRRRRSRWHRLRRYQWGVGLLAVGAVAAWAMHQTDKATVAHTQWERMRRERVTPAQQVNIRLDDLKIDLSSEDQAEVRFVQHYAAIAFSGYVTQAAETDPGKWALENHLGNRAVRVKSPGEFRAINHKHPHSGAQKGCQIMLMNR